MERLLRYDHYKVLGVPRDASERSIKRAYREKVKQCHPDRSHAPNAAQVFQAVHDAYATLSEPTARARYDEKLRYYREANDAVDQEPRKRGPINWRRNEERDRPVNRVAFFGLHLTGLLFGVALVGGIVLGILLWDWPLYTAFFAVPGLVVIPDAVAGLRISRTK